MFAVHQSGTVLVGEGLIRGLNEIESSSSSSSDNLATLPASLNGVAGTFPDSILVQSVLDAARLSSDEGGRWVDVQV